MGLPLNADLSFWEKLHNWAKLDQKIILLYVIESQGSSPGRTGFKMIIKKDGEMYGSIGGGIMEHKLIELCKNELFDKDFNPFIERQIHKDNIASNKSGMICSGEQTIAFFGLTRDHQTVLQELWQSIVNGKRGIVSANQDGLTFNQNEQQPLQFESKISDKENWYLKEDLRTFTELQIIGGGHVGLALSNFATKLGYTVKLFDNRTNLNTIEENTYAECIIVDNYDQINGHITSGSTAYVVLTSFGYRTDKIILRQLVKHNYKYLGMMGSSEKVNTIFEELKLEGITEDELGKVHAPIGIPISSQTPEEIAISILAEIIQVKNAN